jgi:hypothetical protein
VTRLRELAHRSGIVSVVRGSELATLRWRARRSAAPSPPIGHGGALRILALAPVYLPRYRRGAEITLHEVLSSLVARGHDCTVAVTSDPSPGVIEGVKVVAGTRESTRPLARESHVLVAQLQSRRAGLRLAAREQRPLVYFEHQGNIARSHFSGHPELTVFSSAAMREEQGWLEPAFVLHPRVDPVAYRTGRGECLTLVNLTGPKGADLFYEIAQMLPDRRFLGVRAWVTQVEPDPLPPNVEIVGPLDDIREAYRRTRVVLAPSVYESFGRVPLEAAASGIPTIAHPNRGAREALGDAAIWASRDDVGAWLDAITALDDPTFYAERSATAELRAPRFAGFDELDELERRLRELAVASGGRDGR